VSISQPCGGGRFGPCIGQPDVTDYIWQRGMRCGVSITGDVKAAIKAALASQAACIDGSRATARGIEPFDSLAAWRTATAFA
jgi:hypothetical protein